MRVSDVMQTSVDFVPAAGTVLDVARLIFGRGINGVPVCEDKKVIGFITERDILNKFFPTMQEFIEDPVHEGDFERMEAKVEEILRFPASKIMSTDTTTVTADTPLLRAQSMMSVKKIGRLPVVDDKGNLIGILSKGDIFRSIVGDKLPFEEDEQFHDWLSKRYDRIVDWDARLAKEIPDLKKFFTNEGVKTILDVGCGTGMHAISLAKEGFNVVGIDRSARMIYEANNKVKLLGSRIKKHVKFVNCEYKDLGKIFSEKFDSAIIMGTGLAHQSNPEQVLNEINKVLKEKAIIICQIANYKKIIKGNKRLFDFNVREFPFAREKEHTFLRFYDPEEHGLLAYNVAVFERARKWMFRGMHTTPIVPLDKEKMTDFFKELTFSKVSFFGGEKGFYYDYLFRKPFDQVKSDVMVVVAKR